MGNRQFEVGELAGLALPQRLSKPRQIFLQTSLRCLDVDRKSGINFHLLSQVGTLQSGIINSKFSVSRPASSRAPRQ
jgi:hypothetical protein